MPTLPDLAAVFDAMPNAFMVLDRDLRYVAANAAYLRIAATTLAQLVGTYVFDVFPDDPDGKETENAKILRASFERVLATGCPDELPALVYRVPSIPGAPLVERVWSARHTPMRDAHGGVAYIIQETLDVTHLREHALERSAPGETTVLDRAARVQANATNLDNELRNLRQMFDQAPGFMAFTRGPQHVFEIVNAAYRQLVAHRDVIGMTVGGALPEIVEQGFVALLDSVFATGRPFIGQAVPVKLQPAPGAELALRYLDFIYQPIRDRNGTVFGIFVQGQDVTAQHEAEAQARDLAAQQAVALAELRARAEYEQRLIGIVSHDLRNPLGAIALGAGLLETMSLPPEAEKTVGRVARAADRASRLIADLLDFAKARIGTTIPINPRPTNLREIVEQVVDEFEILAPAREIRVGFAGDGDVTWDAERIAQVIANLVGNAIQHGPASVPIVLESRIEGDDAVLAVSNEGPAIPAGELDVLFEPFQRGSNATRSSGSMGLGLYIAREVVVAHGGTIRVESDPAIGTRFTVRLPRTV